MLNKLLFVALLGVFVGVVQAEAQTAAPVPISGRVKGRILAARVRGEVSAVSKADGQSHLLKDGESVSEQTQIVTAAGANVILVFSNGATVSVGASSNLDIEEFDQDPFARDFKVSELKQEPGTSTTRLNLTKGELVGKVVHLNVESGSEFTVQTPVGAAGIRGTTFKVVFRPDHNGKAFFAVTTSDGTVVFHGLTKGPVSIPAGKQVVATFDYVEPTPGKSGGPGPIPPVVITTSDTSPADEAAIIGVEQTIIMVDAPIIWVGIPSGGPSGASPQTPAQPNSAPSEPAVPPPVTTPGAGSGP
jgi:FecR protein